MQRLKISIRLKSCLIVGENEKYTQDKLDDNIE